MIIGILSPMIVKLKLNNLKNVGKISGNISALCTLGSIFGTFLGGFYLLPSFGCNEILFVLSIVILLLIFLLKEKSLKQIIITLILIIIGFISFVLFININNNNGKRVLKGELGVQVSYDTEYGRVIIYNKESNNEKYRIFSIDGASESATYINENKRNDLVYEYTKYYDLMFNANIDIKNVLMIGGAGYTYPKYFISKYLDKNIDVVEIDGIVTKLANKYFYLDELKDKNRLNIFTEDGRVFLNKNKKKYDAILNDAFYGEVPSKTLTTIEAVNKIYNSLNKNGVYLTNIVGSIEGENSKFLKSEIYTLRQVF